MWDRAVVVIWSDDGGWKVGSVVVLCYGPKDEQRASLFIAVGVSPKPY